MKSSAAMWWTGVIGASEYMNCISQALEKKDSLLLFVPQRIPWHDCFIQHIKAINPNRNTMSFNLVDCSNVNEENLGVFLLEKFGTTEQYEGYDGSGITTYLKDNNVLKNRTVWLYNLPERLENRWINYVLEYKKKCPNCEEYGILCMEIGYTEHMTVNNPCIDAIAWETHISNYDVLMFAMHRVRNLNEMDSIKNYVAQIASSIASLDIEFCDTLIDDYYRLIRYPETTVQNVCNKIYTNDKAKIFRMSRRQFNYIIWSAQEQVLFPIIERERLNFIKKYYHIVSANFDKVKARGMQNIDLDTPMDMELGTLIAMCENGLEGTSKIKGTFADWNMLRILRHVRNKIAHGQLIDDFSLFYRVVSCKFV